MRINKVVLLLSLSIAYNAIGLAQSPIDPMATKKTKHLLINLHDMATKGIMFGHEDDDAYGVGWNEIPGRSDVKETGGSYPAIHGWDVGHLHMDYNLDSVFFDKMIGWIKDTYKRGGINTVSWHNDNPVSGGSTWDKTPAVGQILPGGSHHDAYKVKLDELADFFKQCKIKNTYIPIIFRPYHEHNGEWFWWGKGNCTEDEYIALWQFTVKYLHDEKDIHHILYAFSPDRGRMNLDEGKASYLYGYPGDNYVDIIGYDNYWDVGHPANQLSKAENAANLARGLQLITKIAKEKGKVATFSETGQESIKNEKWFTEIILNPIKQSDEPIEIAWVLVWRNNDIKHHYAPYTGHKSVENFKEFVNDPLIFMESDLRNPYKKGKGLQKKSVRP